MGKIPAPPLIDYGRPVPIRRRLRRWGVRLIFLGWAALTLWLAYDKWGEWVPAEGELLRQQRACLAFTLPPGTIVYESPGEKADELLQSPNYRGDSHIAGFFTTETPAAVDVRMPNVISDRDDARDELLRLHKFRYPGALEVDFNSDQFEWMFADGVGPSGCVSVFLHKLRASDGTERLVHVRGRWFHEKGAWFDFSASVEPIEGWLTSRDQTAGTGIPSSSLSVKGIPTRIYAGQLDPARSDGFLIDYLIGTNRFRVRGLLLPSGVIQWVDMGMQTTREGQ